MAIGIITFLILVIVLSLFLRKQNMMHEVVGGLLNKGEYESKYYMDSFINTIKNKVNLPDALKDRSSSFDYITFNILRAKKNILQDLYPNLSLQEAIKQRPFDGSQFSDALKFEGCLYDQEVELLNSLVLLDEDDVLAMPFYNEVLLKAKILQDANDVLIEEYKKHDDLFKAKCEVIRLIKNRYKDINKDLIDGVLNDEIDL